MAQTLPSSNRPADHIKVHKLGLTANVRDSAWPSPSQDCGVIQPLLISLDIETDISIAGASDTLASSVNYAYACSLVQRVVSEASDAKPCLTCYDLTRKILDTLFEEIDSAFDKISLLVEIPKAVLLAESCSVSISKWRDESNPDMNCFTIKGLPLTAVIGILPHERERKQPLLISLEFTQTIYDQHLPDAFSGLVFVDIEQKVSDFVQASSYLTLEALATRVAEQCLRIFKEEGWSVTVTISKPAALALAASPEVTIMRSHKDILGPNPEDKIQEIHHDTKVLAALAFGSNIGDRFRNIEMALQRLETSGTIHVVDTSFLYETAPMYVTDQPSFINGALLVETTLAPTDLLRAVKLVEEYLGREKSIRFGPREIDLDILTYGSEVIDTRPISERGSLDNLDGHLVVPHPRMWEREFVLRPLHDIISDWVHPQLKMPIRSLLQQLQRTKNVGEPPMLKVLPFPSTSSRLDVPPTKTYWTLPNSGESAIQPAPRTSIKRTFLMATLNVTPDSFSDGGKHLNLSSALSYVEDSIANGADIIDIGGYSTRPGASVVSTEDELNRVLPIIRAIREHEDVTVKDVLISVDTFRPEVARASVLAGANVINDVYAFSGPSYPLTRGSEREFQQMRWLARDMGFPVIMMHSRGDAGANKDYGMYAVKPDHNVSDSVFSAPVLEAVKIELGEKVEKAIKGRGGLRRWQVIIDPGIGFSKSEADNLTLLRHAHDLVAYTHSKNALAGFPMLVGASRKSFLGSIVARPHNSNAKKDGMGVVTSPRPAGERDFATAAAVSCAVQQGVDIVRVHNVRAMADVVKVSEALWS